MNEELERRTICGSIRSPDHGGKERERERVGGERGEKRRDGREKGRRGGSIPSIMIFGKARGHSTR